MSMESREHASVLTEAEQKLIVDSKSLNAVVAEMALQEKAALKTYMQVELNDYLQE